MSTSWRTNLGPVSCGPLRRALWFGAGLLVCRALGWAKGVWQFQYAAICQPLFAQDLPPLKSSTTAPWALQPQIHSGLTDNISNICLGCHFLSLTPYLSPVTCFPHGRTVKAVAGLDWTGLRALTVFIPQNFSAVTVPRGVVSARHCAAHQTNPTGSRARTPLSGVPPAKMGDLS